MSENSLGAVSIHADAEKTLFNQATERIVCDTLASKRRKQVFPLPKSKIKPALRQEMERFEKASIKALAKRLVNPETGKTVTSRHVAHLLEEIEKDPFESRELRRKAAAFRERGNNISGKTKQLLVAKEALRLLLKENVKNYEQLRKRLKLGASTTVLLEKSLRMLVQSPGFGKSESGDTGLKEKIERLEGKRDERLGIMSGKTGMLVLQAAAENPNISIGELTGKLAERGQKIPHGNVHTILFHALQKENTPTWLKMTIRGIFRRGHWKAGERRRKTRIKTNVIQPARIVNLIFKEWNNYIRKTVRESLLDKKNPRDFDNALFYTQGKLVEELERHKTGNEQEIKHTMQKIPFYVLHYFSGVKRERKELFELFKQKRRLGEILESRT